MARTYKCPMCGHTIKTEKYFDKKNPLLCPECLAKNTHIPVMDLENWIRMEQVKPKRD